MRTLLVTGADTGVGKTQVTAALARLLAAGGARVQIVKAVETGSPAQGDAERARELAGADAEVFTLAAFAAPLAPLAAAALEGRAFSMEAMTDALRALPPCDWRIVEGAGGDRGAGGRGRARLGGFCGDDRGGAGGAGGRGPAGSD